MGNVNQSELTTTRVTVRMGSSLTKTPEPACQSTPNTELYMATKLSEMMPTAMLLANRERVMRCHTFGAPSAADGVTITTTDGISRCEARASNSKKFPIMAVAYCGDDTVMTDPCTQDEIHGIEYRNKADKSPTVECPGGYVMESCIFHSPWSQQLTAENRVRINSIGAVDINDDGSCSMENCLTNPAGHQWCKLTAVCKKLTGSEYLKAACPTCDDVRCPEGQECQMVKDLPVCLPRVPGGCETDKCGKGECVEDGPNYKCLCDEGYKFDGTTCQDVDELLKSHVETESVPTPRDPTHVTVTKGTSLFTAPVRTSTSVWTTHVTTLRDALILREVTSATAWTRSSRTGKPRNAYAPTGMKTKTVNVLTLTSVRIILVAKLRSV